MIHEYAPYIVEEDQPNANTAGLLTAHTRANVGTLCVAEHRLLAFRLRVLPPLVLGLVALCVLSLRLLVPLLLVRHVLDLRRRLFWLLTLQPRMLETMKLRS